MTDHFSRGLLNKGRAALRRPGLEMLSFLAERAGIGVSDVQTYFAAVRVSQDRANR